MANNDNYEEDLDNINFGDYKGIYFDQQDNNKYTCPKSGAHFKFTDMCARMTKVQDKR